MTFSKYIFFVLFLIGFWGLGQEYSISGVVSDSTDEPAAYLTVYLEGTDWETQTNPNGYYKLGPLPEGTYMLVVEFSGNILEKRNISLQGKNERINLTMPVEVLKTVEISSNGKDKPKRLEEITRFPVGIQDQPMSISIIPEKLIEEQGILTLTDAAKNTPGVVQFASYGGIRESMSIRGFRGTPVLKNGARMDSDFRSAAAISDMSGVESIQIIKGAAAITQGVGDGLGSAGGVINVVTKTPKYRKEGEVGIRSGSWWRSRMEYDLQTVAGQSDNLGFRVAGAVQAGNTYWDKVRNNRVYVAPSFGWKIGNQTEVLLTMDYLKEKSTPNRGTVNLGPDNVEALYNMKHKFSGFDDDQMKIDNLTYSAVVKHKISSKIEARAGVYHSYYKSNSRGATLSFFMDEAGDTIYNKRHRGIGKDRRVDRNTTVQADLIGKHIRYGIFEWNWQAGYDYSMSKVMTNSAAGVRNLDVIDVLGAIPNPSVFSLPGYDEESMELNPGVHSDSYYYGFMTQHHLAISEYAKIIGGIRWSYSINASKGVVDPIVGLILTPVKNINIYGSYTTTSSLRTADNPLENGGTVGIARTKQFEAGIKSNWFQNRLRANFSYFNILNKNLAYQIYDDNQTPTGVYGLGGDLKRRGFEVEISGQLTRNLEIVTGYAYLDAFYKNSPAYVDGSQPMNTPTNTFNGWLHYDFTQSGWEGFSVGAGLYYIGKRPVNDYTKISTSHDTQVGVKYFDMPAYTTLNAQLGYTLKQFDFKLFFNNITGARGYNSYYRGGFINQIDPFNISGQINFKF